MLTKYTFLDLMLLQHVYWINKWFSLSTLILFYNYSSILQLPNHSSVTTYLTHYGSYRTTVDPSAQNTLNGYICNSSNITDQPKSWVLKSIKLINMSPGGVWIIIAGAAEIIIHNIILPITICWMNTLGYTEHTSNNRWYFIIRWNGLANNADNGNLWSIFCLHFYGNRNQVKK